MRSLLLALCGAALAFGQVSQIPGPGSGSTGVTSVGGQTGALTLTANQICAAGSALFICNPLTLTSGFTVSTNAVVQAESYTSGVNDSTQLTGVLQLNAYASGTPYGVKVITTPSLSTTLGQTVNVPGADSNTTAFMLSDGAGFSYLDVGTANAISYTADSPITAANVLTCFTKANSWNSGGATTLSIDGGVTTKSLFWNGAALAAYVLGPNQPLCAIYDGTEWDLVSPPSSTDLRAGYACQGTPTCTSWGFFVPKLAGLVLSTGTAGAIGYDSTNNNYHLYNGADQIMALFATSPTNGACVQASVTSGRVNMSTPTTSACVPAASPTFTGTVTLPKITTTANCSNAASPAVCAAAGSGAVAVPTGTNPTLVVDTTAVTANSEIILQPDQTLTVGSATCNTTAASLALQPYISARTAGTSFTITLVGTISTNPVCMAYTIVN